MKKVLFWVFVVCLCVSFKHDKEGFPVLIIRESELGVYDTMQDTLTMLWEKVHCYHTNKGVFPRPKYVIVEAPRKKSK